MFSQIVENLKADIAKIKFKPYLPLPKKPRLDIPMIEDAVIQVSLTIDEKTFWIKQGRSQG